MLPYPNLNRFPDSVVLANARYEHSFGIDQSQRFVQDVIRVHRCILAGVAQ